MFQLTAAEHVQLNRSQIVTGSQRHRGPRNIPYAFTEQGVVLCLVSLSLESSRTSCHFLRKNQSGLDVLENSAYYPANDF